jgi:Tol biopolymer transport system component
LWRARPANEPPPPREMRFEIDTPFTVERQSIALSPDGSRIVFVASATSPRHLWLRSLDASTSRLLERTEDARYPFWSPDGNSVGFFSQGKLKVLDVATGGIRIVADASRGLGGTWNADGVIVFAPTYGGPLHRVSQAGGPSVPVTSIGGAIVRQASPQFLPDGRHFLFYADGNDDERGVWVGQLDDLHAQRVVNDADAAAVFMPPASLLYPRASALVVQRFDPIERRVTGEPAQVAESIYFDPLQSVSALSAANGTLVYRMRLELGTGGRLAWFDRSGREVERLDSPTDAAANSLNLSPDQKRLAIGRGQQRGIWLLDLESHIIAPLVRLGNQPVWSHDGHRLAFAATKSSRVLDLYTTTLDGNGRDELLLATAQTKTPSDWSPSNDVLLFRSIDPVTRSDLWAMPLAGDHKPVVVLKTDADERDPQFSPDGRWIAYESDRTGRSEIFLQPNGPGTAKQVSSDGGVQVRWRSDGRELFYVREDRQLMAVRVEDLNAANPIVRPPVALFPVPLAIGGPALQQYAPSRDGQRFLVNVIRERAAEPISVVLNWPGLPVPERGR